jgi:hypothetical protein
MYFSTKNYLKSNTAKHTFRRGSSQGTICHLPMACILVPCQPISMRWLNSLVINVILELLLHDLMDLRYKEKN